MPRYLISVIRDTGASLSDQESADMRRSVDALNDAMVRARVRVFVGGLRPVTETHRWTWDGETTRADDPVASPGTYLDGLWVLECATREEAQEWGRKASMACRSSIEVRPFY